MKVRNCLVSIILLLLALPTSPLFADGHKGFFFIGEYFFPLDLSTKLDLTSEDLDFGEISLENDLGLESDLTQERFRGGYRFGKRSEIELSYLSIARSSNAVLTRTFDHPLLPQPVDVSFDVFTRFDTEDVEFSYKFYLVARDAVDLGLSIGLHQISADFSLSGVASTSLPGLPELEFGGMASDSFDAPLPVVGLHGTARIGERVALRGHFKVFDATYQDYSATYTDLQASLEVRVWKALSLGGGFYLNEIDAEDTAAQRGTGSLEIIGVDVDREGVFAFVRLGK